MGVATLSQHPLLNLFEPQGPKGTGIEKNPVKVGVAKVLQQPTFILLSSPFEFFCYFTDLTQTGTVNVGVGATKSRRDLAG